jgi:hypothetical protein
MLLVWERVGRPSPVKLFSGNTEIVNFPVDDKAVYQALSDLGGGLLPGSSSSARNPNPAPPGRERDHLLKAITSL